MSNLLTQYAEEFQFWNQQYGSVTISSNVLFSPIGDMSVDLLEVDPPNLGDALSNPQGNIVVGLNTDYFISVFVGKGGLKSNSDVIITLKGASGTQTSNYSVENNAFSYIGSGILDYGIQDYGNFNRIWIKCNSGSLSYTRANFEFYRADQYNNSAYLWGYQINTGPSLTQYISQSGKAVLVPEYFSLSSVSETVLLPGYVYNASLNIEAVSTDSDTNTKDMLSIYNINGLSSGLYLPFNNTEQYIEQSISNLNNVDFDNQRISYEESLAFVSFVPDLFNVRLNSSASFDLRLEIFNRQSTTYFYPIVLDRLLGGFTPELKRQYEDSKLFNAFINAISYNLATSRQAIFDAINELNIQKASGLFLELWQDIVGLQRRDKESDDAYRKRILNSVFLDKISNIAIERFLSSKYAYIASNYNEDKFTVQVVDTGKDPTTYGDNNPWNVKTQSNTVGVNIPNVQTNSLDPTLIASLYEDVESMIAVGNIVTRITAQFSSRDFSDFANKYGPIYFVKNHPASDSAVDIIVDSLGDNEKIYVDNQWKFKDGVFGIKLFDRNSVADDIVTIENNWLNRSLPIYSNSSFYCDSLLV